MSEPKIKIEYAARGANIEERSVSIPTEIREEVEKANATPVVDPETTEYRGGRRVLQYRRP